MGKGFKGESCPEAIRSVMRDGEIVSYSELFARVRGMGAWEDRRIWISVMSSIVNLSPARREWPKEVPFLFLHDDGRVSLYDERVHPKVVD